MMPFAATWMVLETIILSKVKSERERQMPSDITYMWNLEYDTNEPFMKHTHRHRELVGAKVGGRVGRDGLGVWDQQMQTILYRVDKQQGPTIYHKELYSISYNKP